MRKGILSLIMPQSRKNTRKNIAKAEQTATASAQPILKSPVPDPEPIKAEPVAQPMEAPFVQRVYVPKTPSLLKSVTKKHDEMARKARRSTY